MYIYIYMRMYLHIYIYIHTYLDGNRRYGVAVHRALREHGLNHMARNPGLSDICYHSNNNSSNSIVILIVMIVIVV